MENKLMVFENKQVEVFEFNGQVLFNPKHVAECLDITDVISSTRNFNEKQLIKLTNSIMHSTQFRKLHNTGENFLTESGVYKLIFQSRKAEAEKFQDWVTDEVLPSIRKHGAYMTEDTLEKALASPDFLIQLATRLKESKVENELLKNENKVLAPKAEYTDKVLNTDGLFTITEIAKDFGLKSAYALNKILNGFKVIRNVNGKWCLYSDYCGKGYAKDKVMVIKRKDGTSKTVSDLYWTEKGRKFLYDFLKMQELIKEAV